MNVLQMVSIFLEVLMVALAIILVVGRKKMYGWCIALTFVLYIFYDLLNFLSLRVSRDSLDILFIMATTSTILWAIWNIFLEAFGPGSIEQQIEDRGKDPLLSRSDGQMAR